jgi:hypothetical protein
MDTLSAPATASEDLQLRQRLLRDEPQNPALQRLKGRMLTSAEPSEVITSYDRMHHRHSRS